MVPSSLYIHIPWCIRKCPYCDFNSHKSPKNLPEHQYISALIDDLKHDLTHFPSRTINSIFIGGGTPSLLSAKAYEKLFDEVQKLLVFASNIEITLEANPGTIDERRFHDYRKLGINRLSLGIQSFNAGHLQQLGRIHNDKQAHTAIERARQAGFDNLNIDLMHGLPNQTLKEGINDLQTALSYQPEHLSWYQLTIEPNTVFYNAPPKLPTEEITYTLEEEGLKLLKSNGYERYEISAFSQPGKSCQHNLNYWLYGDYFGIGAGAHGKISLDDGTIYRTRKLRQPNDFLSNKKPFCAALEKVTPDDRMFEFMLNTTRLQQSISLSLFKERTGLSLDALYSKLMEAHSQGFIQLHETHWQVTPFGRRYTNDLQALFLPD
ncbi:radical SAM family heme chaperone HemW [Legionella nagasakiensis]|uniref:radical SAM family heme chaperone HemW n=1 Tax=Legionella nagasakiensis TaxID=535290 RepID=UPI001055AB7E|nr:radical SAM family heme chaperone HemW [Legionella nagasakiensis]